MELDKDLAARSFETVALAGTGPALRQSLADCSASAESLSSSMYLPCILIKMTSENYIYA